MTSPVNDLLTSITSTLLGNAALLRMVGADGIKDRRQLRSNQPYLMVGEVETTDLSTDGDRLLESLVTLQAWSSISRRETEALADLLRDLLQDAALSLTSATLVSLTHLKTVSRREAKTALYVAEVQFRAVVG
jgi:hypothetical protein